MKRPRLREEQFIRDAREGSIFEAMLPRRPRGTKVVKPIRLWDKQAAKRKL